MRFSSSPRSGLFPFSVYAKEGVGAPPGVGGIFNARYESFFLSLGEEGRGPITDVDEDGSPAYENADAKGFEYEDVEAGDGGTADVEVDQPCGGTCMCVSEVWRALLDGVDNVLSFLSSCRLLYVGEAEVASLMLVPVL